MVYAQCLHDSGIETPDTRYFELPGGQAAFGTRRFDRHDGMRVPMQSLASFTGANYQVAGSMDYVNFLRATQLCTNNVQEKVRAFERVVFNVIFNNRDDHPKNVAYLMSSTGDWTLAPAFDVTYCDGPGGYHQMDVMGEALNPAYNHIRSLGMREADLSEKEVRHIIDKIASVASTFTVLANQLLLGKITRDTLRYIQQNIDGNIRRIS